MKKIRGNEPMGVIIEKYMEISQGNPLYLKQAKMSFFLVVCLFYLVSFLLQNQGGGTSPAQGGGLVPVGGGR
jgi:hypothetical protein